MQRADSDQVRIIESTGENVAKLIRILQTNLTNGESFIGSIDQPGESKYYIKISKDGSQLIINNMRLSDGRFIDINVNIEELPVLQLLGE